MDGETITTDMVRLVPPREIADLWADVAPMLKQALAHGDNNFGLADILYRLLMEEQQLWIIDDGIEIVACAVTQILQFPTKRVLSLPLLAGERLDRWRHCESRLVEHARQFGCEALEGYARQGWAKKAPPGWYPVYTVIRREVPKE